MMGTNTPKCIHNFALGVICLCVSPLFAESPDPWKVYREWPFSTEEARRRQEETAKALGVPVEKTIDVGNGVSVEMVLILQKQPPA